MCAPSNTRRVQRKGACIRIRTPRCGCCCWCAAAQPDPVRRALLRLRCGVYVAWWWFCVVRVRVFDGASHARSSFIYSIGWGVQQDTTRHNEVRAHSTPMPEESAHCIYIYAVCGLSYRFPSHTGFFPPYHHHQRCMMFANYGSCARTIVHTQHAHNI